MTKKLFIIFLTLCLAVVGMTVIAAADAPTSITIGETTLSNGSTISGGNGTATYQDGVLTLNNFTIEVGNVSVISSAGDLTIEFSGSNSLTANGYEGIYVSGALTINGSTGATLNVTSSDDAIYCCGTLSISGATVSATGDSYAIYSHGMTISSSTVSATATTYGICGDGNGSTVEIIDSTITTYAESGISAISAISISGDVDITAVGGIKSYSSSINITPSTGGILEVTVGSTTSYYSEATSLGTSLSGTVTIKTHTHSYVNNECACGAKDYGTINVGYATLSDGQYTTTGARNSAQDGTPSGTGYAYYSGGVLYLNNFTCEISVTGEKNCIFSSDDLTIVLTGTNSIKFTNAKYGIRVLGDLSVSGNGSLEIITECESESYAIFAGNNITIDSCTIYAEASGYTASAIYSRTGLLTISGSDVTANAISTYDDGKLGYYAHTIRGVNIVIEDGSSITATATATGENVYTRAIYASSIAIEDSTITKADASGYWSDGICAEDTITITGSTVTTTATASEDDGYAYGVYAGGDIAVSDESTVTVTVTGNDGRVNPYGIYAIGNIAITDNSTVSSTAISVNNYDVSAIHSDSGSIEITESEVTVEINGWCGYGVISTFGDNNDIIITDGKVTATITNGEGNNVGAFGAIGDGSDVIISGSDITVTSTAQSWDLGTIYSNGSVSISDSNIYAKSTSKATYGVIRAETGATISDSEVEFITSGTDFAYAIYVPSGDLEIKSSDLTLTATSTTKQSAIYVTDGDIILTPGTGEALEVTLGTNNPVYHYSATTVTDNAWSSYGYVKIAVSNHTHSYTLSVTTKATCTDDGVMTYTCTCGDSYTESIPATGHSYEAVVTEPTCTEKGYTTYTCSVCGDSYTADETEALGHSYEAVVTEPTCTEKGYTTYTCSACGDTYTANETEPTGHTHLFTEFTWASDLLSANAVYTCHCGDTVSAEAVVTMQGDNGIYTMTATITDSDGTVHTDTQTAGVSLSTIAADYTSVNGAIAKANALNAASYSNFDIVTSAINKVQWNLSVVNQETVNAYAEAIETAIANLIPVDNTEVTIDEPIEDTDTEPEPDEETLPEENPTTGIALALLPMAMALAGVVSRKRLG